MEWPYHHHCKKEAIMKRPVLMTFAGVLLIISAVPAAAQVAGSTTLGVSVAELRDVVEGWSAKRQILGQSVYSDKQERIGTVEDIIISPDKSVSYGIVGAGGFLGFDKRDVAIPVNQFKLTDGKLVLPGATKEALREMPPFEYAPRSEGRGLR
jgi:sporulation protein YlmC with PRC-barrel domain